MNSITGRFVFLLLYLGEKLSKTLMLCRKTFLQFHYQRKFVFYTKNTTAVKLFFMQKHLFAIKVNMCLSVICTIKYNENIMVCGIVGV